MVYVEKIPPEIADRLGISSFQALHQKQYQNLH